jgi:hypothetical protein
MPEIGQSGGEMLSFRLFIIYSVIALSATGCATTSISDFTDPAYADMTYQSIAVWAKTEDLEWRQDLESVLQDRIVAKSGADATRVIDFAPPTRGFSNEEVLQLAQGRNIEAILVIAFTASGINQTYATNVGTGQLDTYNRPWGNAEAMLIDVQGSSIAWKGNTSTSGNGYANWETIRASAGSTLVSRLLEIGLLPQPPNEATKK